MNFAGKNACSLSGTELGKLDAIKEELVENITKNEGKNYISS